MQSRVETGGGEPPGVGAIEQIRTVLLDDRRKPLPRIAYEAALSGIRGRRPPKSYFTNMLYRRGTTLRDFIHDKDLRRIYAYVDDPGGTGMFFRNKVLFHKHFQDSGIPLAKLVGYNFHEQFFSSGEVHDMTDQAFFGSLLRELLEETRSGSIFAKTLSGFGGYGAFRIDSPLTERLDALHQRVLNGRFLFEETLIQHPAVSEVYSHSLNTIRVITIFDRQGRVNVACAAMRFGANGNPVDNAHSGGFFVAVDLESGALRPPGRRFLRYGGGVVERHPETHFELDGFVVPHWEPALAMVRAAAEYLPFPLVGWDVGITDRGPVVVEGNHDPDIRMTEIATGGFRKNPVFQEFVERVRGR